MAEYLVLFFIYLIGPISFLLSRASTTKNGNSIFIMENSDFGGFETLETPNIFLYPSISSLVSILIWSVLL